MHEYDFFTQGLIYTRRVWFLQKKVRLPHTKCDFYTQCYFHTQIVILKRTSVILKRTSVILTHTSVTLWDCNPYECHEDTQECDLHTHPLRVKNIFMIPYSQFRPISTQTRHFSVIFEHEHYLRLKFLVFI
jgi:hypothetical protein